MFSALRIVTQPTALPITVADAKLHARVDASFDDALVQGLIAVATDYAQNFLGRVLVPTTYQWVIAQGHPHHSDWPYFGFYPSQVIGLPYFNWHHHRAIEFPRSPVTSVSDVRVQFFDGSPDLVYDPTEFLLDVQTDPARIRLLQHVWSAEMRHLSITFGAGYVDPTTIPVTILHAIKMMVAHLYQHRGDGEMGEFPAFITNLLNQQKVQYFG